jgi:hypothetical protein
MVKAPEEEMVVGVIDEEIDMLDQADQDDDEPAEPAQKRVRPGGSVKKVKTRLEEKRKAEKVMKKKVTKKTATAAAVSPKKKGTKAEKAEKGAGGVPINAVATLKFLTKHPGSERTAIREKTGIENLGLPWLVAEGHVKETIVEGQRARQFTITKKGTTFLQKK